MNNGPNDLSTAHPNDVQYLVNFSSPPYPIGSCHLHYHLDGSPAEVAAVAAHHHGAALSVPQVDGGQEALDVVLQVVLLSLKHRSLPPQPVGAGPLVLKGGGLDRHHRDGARLHPPSCFLSRPSGAVAGSSE